MYLAKADFQFNLSRSLSHYWIALKGQQHQDRASPYYSGVSIKIALKG